MAWLSTLTPNLYKPFMELSPSENFLMNSFQLLKLLLSIFKA